MKVRSYKLKVTLSWVTGEDDVTNAFTHNSTSGSRRTRKVSDLLVSKGSWPQPVYLVLHLKPTKFGTSQNTKNQRRREKTNRNDYVVETRVDDLKYIEWKTHGRPNWTSDRSNRNETSILFSPDRRCRRQARPETRLSKKLNFRNTSYCKQKYEFFKDFCITYHVEWQEIFFFFSEIR